MTTMAALLGSLPLALGSGAGSKLRRPLGIAIVGGLVLSQFLTLFTTPVMYIYLGKITHRSSRRQRLRIWFWCWKSATVFGFKPQNEFEHQIGTDPVAPSQQSRLPTDSVA